MRRLRAPFLPAHPEVVDAASRPAP